MCEPLSGVLCECGPQPSGSALDPACAASWRPFGTDQSNRFAVGGSQGFAQSPWCSLDPGIASALVLPFAFRTLFCDCSVTIGVLSTRTNHFGACHSPLPLSLRRGPFANGRRTLPLSEGRFAAKGPFSLQNWVSAGSNRKESLPRFRKRKENLAVLWIRARQSSRSLGAKDSCPQNLGSTCSKSSVGLPSGTTYIQKQKVVTRGFTKSEGETCRCGKSYLPFAPFVLLHRPLGPPTKFTTLSSRLASQFH